MNETERNVRIYSKVYKELLVQWEAELAAMDPKDYLFETRKNTVNEMKIKIKLLNDLNNF